MLKLIKLGIAFAEGKHFSLKDIEQWLDVSVPTARRYINRLREEFGAPVARIACEGRHYIYGCSLPWSMVEALKK